MDTVLTSVRKTRRAMVLNEAHRTAGFCSELAARITEELFDMLVAPVPAWPQRTCRSPRLFWRSFRFPGPEEICAAARSLVQRRKA